MAEVRRAARQGALTGDGCCLAESFHLLEEALRSGCRIRAALVASSASRRLQDLAVGHGVRLFILPDALFDELSSTENSQGVLALVEPPRWSIKDILGPPALVVILDSVRDPGNAGAILRSAEAFGASGAVLTKGSVNPFNPKAVRASAGSVFRLPLLTGIKQETLAQAGLPLYAAVPRGGKPLTAVDLSRDCALIFGNEADGVQQLLLGRATAISIPTRRVESLNAAVAAGVVLYEASRQRGALR